MTPLLACPRSRNIGVHFPRRIPAALYATTPILTSFSWSVPSFSHLFRRFLYPSIALSNTHTWKMSPSYSSCMEIDIQHLGSLPWHVIRLATVVVLEPGSTTREASSQPWPYGVSQLISSRPWFIFTILSFKILVDTLSPKNAAGVDILIISLIAFYFRILGIPTLRTNPHQLLRPLATTFFILCHLRAIKLNPIVYRGPSVPDKYARSLWPPGPFVGTFTRMMKITVLMRSRANIRVVCISKARNHMSGGWKVVRGLRVVEQRWVIGFCVRAPGRIETNLIMCSSGKPPSMFNIQTKRTKHLVFNHVKLVT